MQKQIGGCAAVLQEADAEAGFCASTSPRGLRGFKNDHQTRAPVEVEETSWLAVRESTKSQSKGPKCNYVSGFCAERDVISRGRWSRDYSDAWRWKRRRSSDAFRHVTVATKMRGKLIFHSSRPLLTNNWDAWRDGNKLCSSQSNNKSFSQLLYTFSESVFLRSLHRNQNTRK